MSCKQNSRFGCVVYGYEGSVSITETCPLENVAVKRGVPFLLWEQKRGFKDYRRFQSLMNLTELNYSHTFKRQAETIEVGCHCFKCWNVFVISTKKKMFNMQGEAFFFLVH